MNRFSKTNTLLFDFGGTLDSDGLPWKERFFPLYQKEGFRWTEEEFSKYFYFSDDYWTLKTFQKVSYRRTIVKQVALLLKKAGSYDKKIAERVSGKFLSDSLKMIKRNLPLIKKLSKKYKMGIVSNFYGNLPFIFKETGLSNYFGAVIDSSNVGVIKPDPKIFNAALNRLGSKVEESIFIGDNLFRDMGGAKQMGMKHIWIKNDLFKSKKPCCKKDIVIQSFLELEKFLL